MAITADKLLNRPSELNRRYAGRLAMKESLQERMVAGGSSSVVLSKKSIKSIGIIKDKVIEIDSLLKGTLAVEKKKLDTQKRLESGKRREKEEEKLETKPQAEKGPIKTPSLPRMGFLAWVKNFIGNIILGYFAIRLLKFLPKITPILKFIGSATDFVIDVGGKLLDGLATFIDWGYKAYDATRGFVKNLFGENDAKQFDELSGLLNKFLNLALIAGMVAAGSGGPSGRPSRGGGNLTGIRGAADAAGRSRYGTSAAAARRYAERFGKDAAVRKFGEEGVRSLGGKYARSGATNLARKALVGTLGKGGSKAVLRLVKPVVGRLPIIGGLLEFGISWALGDPIGKAAFRGIGAGLIGAVGTVIGGPIGMAIGGFIGGEAGGALYDMFFGNQKPKPVTDKTQGKVGGGITRGGKTLTGVKREIGGDKKKGKYKRILAKEPSKTQFKADPKDPLVKSAQDLDKTKYFGPVLSVASKLELKEEPTQKDYENVGLGLNLLIAKGIEEGQLKGGLVAAFQEGGIVDSEFLEATEKGSNISNWISTTFQRLFESKVERNLRLIKERKGPAGVPGSQQPGAPDMINIQGGDADFWTLVAVASREDGEPQAWADVAQSIYNRLASGAYSGKTIKDLVLGQMQYEPTWKFPKPGATGKPNQEWYAIKDAASAGIAAGQSEGAMKKVAAAILDPTLQKNAREFIQGRTDFRGYSVSGGVQRKSGDNYFGWYNNYKANKIGSVPNFGATAVAGGGPGGTFVGGGTGSGYGSGGVKIAGDLGDYLKANRNQIGITGSIHQHPRHPGQFTRNYFSYHNQNRALDIGGYGPSHPSSGGRDEQAAVIKALLAWNKQNGYTPVEIIHGSPAFRGLGKYESAPNALHSNHVHVAYAKGGRVLKTTFAMLGEKGPEFVFDADTTAGLDRIAPQLLDRLNMARTKPQLAGILQSYTSYEQPYAEPQIVEVPVLVSVPMNGGDGGSSGGLMSMGGGEESNSFDALYIGG